MRVATVLLVVSALFVIGCESKLDASSPETFASSVENVHDSLEREEQDKFEAYLFVLTLFALDERDDGEDPDEILEQFDGMTAEDVVEEFEQLARRGEIELELESEFLPEIFAVINELDVTIVGEETMFEDLEGLERRLQEVEQAHEVEEVSVDEGYRGGESGTGDEQPVDVSVDCQGESECRQQAEEHYERGVELLELSGIGSNLFDGYVELLKAKTALQQGGIDEVPGQMENLEERHDDARDELDEEFQNLRWRFDDARRMEDHEEMAVVLDETRETFPDPSAQEYQWADEQERQMRAAGEYPDGPAPGR